MMARLRHPLSRLAAPVAARLAMGAMLVALAACSPTEVADKIGRRTAETVVLPVVSRNLSGPAANTAMRCIVDNASAAEIQALVQDAGVVAGTRTEANIRAIAAGPAAACLAQAGIGGI